MGKLTSGLRMPCQGRGTSRTISRATRRRCSRRRLEDGVLSFERKSSALRAT